MRVLGPVAFEWSVNRWLIELRALQGYDVDIRFL